MLVWKFGVGESSQSAATSHSYLDGRKEDNGGGDWRLCGTGWWANAVGLCSKAVGRVERESEALCGDESMAGDNDVSRGPTELYDT